MAIEKPFVAVVLYESTSDSPDYRTLYREDFVLVFARDEEEARETARQRAERESGSHHNERGELITLSLKHIVDVAPALDDDLGRGGDLYARHFTDIDAYRRFEPLLSEKD
ncbi:DUF4288 domain-containing protein [Amycolatopsis sp. NPDC059027]|uniref:DUF4288 domain-containing protein n=1 Tax=unclassified Amycolatopsis TaxID=2618356 RepID=UPI00366B6FB1